MGILDEAIREHLELKKAHGAPDDEIRQKELEAFGPVRQEAAPAPPSADLEPATEHIPAAGEHVPVAEDPYTVHPGDHPVPDPHDHAEPIASDPPYREDSELLSGPAGDEPAADARAAADAGAGTLEPGGHDADPGPALVEEEPISAPETPVEPHPDEPHPALHDRDDLRGEVHPPEPVFEPEDEAPPIERPPAPEPTEPAPPAEPAPAEDPPMGDPPPEEHEAGADEDVLEETPEFLQDAPEHDRLWFEQRPPRDFDFGE
jgi:hypothetical protein